MRTATTAIGLVALLAAGAGCGFEAGDSAFDDQQLETESDDTNGDSPEELGGGSGAGTLEGTWLSIHVSSTCVFDQEQVSAAYHIVDIQQDGGGLIEDRRLCRLDLTEVLGSRPVASDEVLATVEYPRVDRGMVSHPDEGGHYSSATAVGLWGLQLDDPVAEPVPEDPDDPRVVDADGNGHPGITFELVGAGCDRFMSQREITRFHGVLEAPNDIRGTSVRDTTTRVYDGTAAMCEMSPQIRSNDEFSFFRMVRVDGRGGAVDATGEDGQISCEDVVDYVEDLHEVREPDHDHCE